MSNYYDRNAKEYIENTINCNMEYHYQKFLKFVKPEGKILDIGFGSGRDMIYFNSLGYEVEGIDTSIRFVNNMLDKGYNVTLLPVEDICKINEYDAIWACASLLHVKREVLKHVLEKCINALKHNGFMYCSFKLGDKVIIKEDRYFNYINEEYFEPLLDSNKADIVEVYRSFDVRIERKNEEWINFIILKL